MILQQMSSMSEFQDKEVRGRYLTGHDLIEDLHPKGIKDFEDVAKAFTKYRRDFLADSSFSGNDGGVGGCDGGEGSSATPTSPGPPPILQTHISTEPAHFQSIPPAIQPRPPRSMESPAPALTSGKGPIIVRTVGPEVFGGEQRKKRGRPSKREAEDRDRRLAAKAKINSKVEEAPPQEQVTTPARRQSAFSKETDASEVKHVSFDNA